MISPELDVVGVIDRQQAVAEQGDQVAKTLPSRQWKFSGWATVTKWLASGPSMKTLRE